jgi:hypothetical protein
MEAMAAVGRNAGQNLDRWPFIAFAVRAAVLAQV